MKAETYKLLSQESYLKNRIESYKAIENLFPKTAATEMAFAEEQLKEILERLRQLGPIGLAVARHSFQSGRGFEISQSRERSMDRGLGR